MDNQNGSETIGRRDKGIHRGGLHLLKEKRVSDILVFGGGTIPKKDLEKLKSLGIGEIFTAGTDTDAIIAYLVLGRNDFLIS